MAFEKGNKLGVGYGRPPKEGFSNDELIVMGEELLQWMKDCDADKKCDVVHLSEWYSEIKRIDRDYWKDSVCSRPCFSSYYKAAMDWIGKRTMKNKNLSTAYGSRFLGIYFKEIRDHEWEQKQKEIDYTIAKKNENTTLVSEEINTQFSSLMGQISDLQDKSSKISEIKEKVE
jgi:hypothetical protein